MKRSPLAHVQHLIKKLSAEDRQKIIPFLAELPDSGLQTYDPTEELDFLKKHGQKTVAKDGPGEPFFALTFVRNMVQVSLPGEPEMPVLIAMFYPNNFESAYPKSKWQLDMYANGFRKLFTDERREAERAAMESHGIQMSDADYENNVSQRCDDIAAYLMSEKGKRIAERMSLHLPGMIEDVMIAALKGETFYDQYETVKALAPDKPLPSLKDFKKMVQDSAWRGVKPHLPSTKHVRTHPDWRGDDTKRGFARKVNDRKALATCIKDKYEECDFEAGWIEDLQQDSTYQLLSTDVPKNVIEHGIKRVASELSERELQPLSVALEMARLELVLKEQDIETLHKYYAEGIRLLKADRIRPPSSI
jgi:hypothetical protein